MRSHRRHGAGRQAGLLVLLAYLFVAPSHSDTTDWAGVAAAWEKLLPELRASGDKEREAEALRAAAIAWVSEGEKRSAAAKNLKPSRLDELEAAARSIDSALAAWRRAANLWKDYGRVSASREDSDGENDARIQRELAFEELVWLEAAFSDYQRRIEERRSSIMDRPISNELQDDLAERWAEVALSWENTAVTLSAAGDTRQAQIARIKAAEQRERIREIKPLLDEAWFLARTYPPGATLPADTSEPETEVSPTLMDAPPQLETTDTLTPPLTAAVDSAPIVADVDSVPVAEDADRRQVDGSGIVSAAEPDTILAIDATNAEAAPRIGFISPAGVPKLISEAEGGNYETVDTNAASTETAVPSTFQPDAVDLSRYETKPAESPFAIPSPDTGLTMPPLWLLSRAEREDASRAEVLRRSAEVWRKTAEELERSGDRTGSTSALAEYASSSEKAREIEVRVRSAYAEREVNIHRMTAQAFGEQIRTETEVLAALDAKGRISAVPPGLKGEAIALAPPPLPVSAEEEQRKGGFLDLEIGGPIPSTLSIRGRKSIDVGYSLTHYPNPSQARELGNTQSSFSLNQELQVSVSGMVGRPDKDHINVNIQFDDTQRGVNSVNNRVIGVGYTTVPRTSSWGTWHLDPRFGDISVSLGGSEFAFYNKSLFGVKTDFTVDKLDLGFFKANHVGLQLFGSQTKGVSASKEFSLSGERIIEDIKDVNFARNKYFRIEPDTTTLPILPSVKIFIDDGVGGSNDAGKVQFTAAGAGAAAGFIQRNSKWRELVAGIDYVLDLNAGIVEMLNFVGENAYIAVEYATQTASFGQSAANPTRMIRVSTSDTTGVRNAFRIHEFRNRYLLSRSRIKKDDPGFVIEIRDGLGFTQTDALGGIPQTYLKLFGFSTERGREDKIDIELIDFDFGVIRPRDTAPFAKTGSAELDNPAIYAKTDVTDADQKYTIHIEYSSDQPQEIFTLGFDILKGSDIVYVDGVQVTRNADYFIDYEAGVITFLNRGLLLPNSKVRVDYEFLPFGGQFERTLLGGRLGVDWTSSLRFGTTFLYDFSAPAREVPDIFEDLPNENAVVELDGAFSLNPLLDKLLGPIKQEEKSLLSTVRRNFRLDMSGEWAWAAQDPNTFGTAIVENFEDIENLIAASFSQFAWMPSARPPDLGLPLASRGVIDLLLKDNFGHLSELQVEAGEKQKSLQVNFDYAAGETWVAMRQPLSSGSINFSDVTNMELFIRGLPKGVKIFVEVGLISEDVDEDGVNDAEDIGIDGVLNTNDAGENNGVLNTGEDVGINLGLRNGRFGVNNGVLNSEDMNGNFQLDLREAFFRLSDTSVGAETSVVKGLGGDTWTILRVPWPSGIATGEAESTVIKHLRLVFVRRDGADTTFSVFMDQLSFRGSRFTGVSNDSRLTIVGRNTASDPNYQSPSLSEIQPDQETKKEQAIGLTWNLRAGDSVTVVQKFRKSIDLSDYDRLSFFIAPDARRETVSILLVSDAQNYIEIRKTATTGASIFDGATNPVWERIDVALEPIRRSTIANILGAGDTEFQIGQTGIQVAVVGQPKEGRSPSLSNINELWLRIASASDSTGEVWIDDIYVAEPREKSGMARKLAFATGWSDLFSVSGAWRDVPGTYKGVGFINNPQSNSYDEISQNSKSVSWSLTLHKLLPSSWDLALPLSGNWSKSTTTLDPDKVVNTLKSNLGTTSSENQSYNLSVRVWKLPSVGLSYSESKSATKFRLDDRTSNSSSFSASTGYGFSFPQKLFGIIPTGRSLSVSSSYSFSLARQKNEHAATSAITDVNSRVENQSLGVSVSAVPISPLSLSYGFSTGFLDRRTLVESERWEGVTGRNHSLSSSLTIPAFFGFTPGVSASGNYNENFSRTTGGGRTKDIGLGGDFRINLGLDPAHWTRLLSWITAGYNYTLSSNASYRSLNTGDQFTDIFGDYVGERVLPWGSVNSIGKGTQGVAANRASGSTNITHNLSGGITTFKWLSTSYSTSFSRNEVASLSTVSVNDGLSGTMNFRMDYNQAFPRSFIKFRSSYLTAAVTYGLNENAASKSSTISPNANWNLQWTDALNTSFSVGWNRSSSLNFAAPSDKTTSSGLTPSMNFTYYFDLPIPESLIKGKLAALSDIQKRVSLSGGVNGSLSQSERAGKTTADNSTYGYSLGLGYRLSSAIDMSASTSGNWRMDKLEPLNETFTMGGNARVEWRF